MANDFLNTLQREASILIANADRDFTLLLSLLLEQTGFSKLLFATDYDEAMEKIVTETIDLFILDTDLGESGKGILLAEEIRSRKLQTPIIYITSNYTDDYYNSAHRTRPVSFLNQELSHLKLRQAVELALLHSETAARPRKRISSKARSISHKQLLVQAGDASRAIPT